MMLMMLASMSPLFALPPELPPPMSFRDPAPSAGDTVVGMKLWLDVTDVSQQLAQHRLPVTTVTGLDTTHSLSGVAVHLHRTVAMGTKGLIIKNVRITQTAGGVG